MCVAMYMSSSSVVKPKPQMETLEDRLREIKHIRNPLDLTVFLLSSPKDRTLKEKAIHDADFPWGVSVWPDIQGIQKGPRMQCAPYTLYILANRDIYLCSTVKNNIPLFLFN